MRIKRLRTVSVNDLPDFWIGNNETFDDLCNELLNAAGGIDTLSSEDRDADPVLYALLEKQYHTAEDALLHYIHAHIAKVLVTVHKWGKEHNR